MDGTEHVRLAGTHPADKLVLEREATVLAGPAFTGNLLRERRIFGKGKYGER